MMTETPLPAGAAQRLALVKMPAQIAVLPRDHRGYPVPKFVLFIDGKPDFRIMDHGYLEHCIKHKTCWICAGRLGRGLTFALGPMCSINRVNSEPPCHLDCARYAVQVCPFLAIPPMRRISHNMPEHSKSAGIMIPRNPGVVGLWRCTHYKVARYPDGGVLFDIGEPSAVEWWREGRAAHRAEVLESIASGLPQLAAMAVEEGPASVADLQARHRAAMAWLPAS
jgi:hypothetical protein